MSTPNDGTKVIIYPFASTFNIICANPNYAATLEEIANKDVPKGLAFKIIDKDDLPQDPTYRSAWTYDFSKNDGISTGTLPVRAENTAEIQKSYAAVQATIVANHVAQAKMFEDATS